MSPPRGPDCERAREGLLDGIDSPAHLSSCAHCRAFATRLAMVDAALAAGDPRGSKLPSMVDPVLRSIYRTRDRQTTRLLAAAVACMVLLVGAAGGWVLSAVDVGLFAGFGDVASAHAISELLGSGWRQLASFAVDGGGHDLPALPAALDANFFAMLIAAGAFSSVIRWMAQES